MTKEELKKEGKLYAQRLFDEEAQAYLHDMVIRVYVESAEPREKRITELESQVNRQIKNVLRLETQIEKMKSNVELARDNANETENWETFNVLNSILDDWYIKENEK